MGIAVQCQNAAAWSATVEKLRRVDLGAITLSDVLGIRVVVMNTNDVCRCALPTIIADHGPRAVECFCQMVERLDSVAMLIDRRQFGHTPRFVEGYPHNNARVAV